MAKTLFITGIGTDVGKTIASAIVVEALQADYFKPIQAGDLDNSDTHKVKALVTNPDSRFHANAYALHTPMSPHAAAEIDGVCIELDNVIRPTTKKHLVVEGAGGLLVPINDEQTILDIIKPSDYVLVISRHYLGSINHTLMTLKLLQERNFKCALIFNGKEHKTTESIIMKMADIACLGRIEDEDIINTQVVQEYAQKFKPALGHFLAS